MDTLIVENIIQDSIYSSLSYESYKNLIEEEVKAYVAPEDTKSPDMGYFTKLNYQRMKRLDKTLSLNEESITFLSSYFNHQTWVVICEGWCGDGAQVVPVINKMAEVAPGIKLRIVLRDENPDLMDNFLTNGTRSIPKLIIFDEEKQNVLGTWGPRPAGAIKFVQALKDEGTPSAEIKFHIQKWYTQNKGVEIQNEIIDILRELKF